MDVPVGELPHPDIDGVPITRILFALSDPNRLAVVYHLASEPENAGQCPASINGLPKSTKSHIYKVLRESGIIRNEPDGRSRKLRLRKSEIDLVYPGLMDAVINSHKQY